MCNLIVRTSKSVSEDSSKTSGLFQCAFVDGNNGRCQEFHTSIYCRAHKKIIKKIDGAFGEFSGRTIGLSKNNESVSKKPSSKGRHGLTTGKLVSET